MNIKDAFDKSYLKIENISIKNKQTNSNDNDNINEQKTNTLHEDKVTISHQGKVLSTENIEQNNIKIEEIKQKINNNTYEINASNIANKMISLGDL